MTTNIVYTSNTDNERLFISNLIEGSRTKSMKWKGAQGLLFILVLASFVTLCMVTMARLPHHNNLEMWLEDGGALVGTIFFAKLLGKVTVIIGKRNDHIDDFKEHQENLKYKEEGRYQTSQTSKTQKLWNNFLFHLKHFVNSHAHYVRSNIFNQVKGCKFLAPSYNCGRKEDIPKYVDPQRVDVEFAKDVEKDRTFVSPAYTLGPFSGGICLGMSLTFARDYFKTRDVRITAEKFTKGGSEEAVVVQAKYEKLFTENLFSFQRNVENYSLVTERPTSKAKFFKAKARIANLRHESHQTDLNYEKALSQISQLNEGVYQIGLPVFSGKSIDGGHSILFIKEKDTCTLFDPNHGTGSIDTSEGATLVKVFLDHYGTNHLVDIEESSITISKLDQAATI